jgi:hypothetical protein
MVLDMDLLESCSEESKGLFGQNERPECRREVHTKKVERTATLGPIDEDGPRDPQGVNNTVEITA